MFGMSRMLIAATGEEEVIDYSEFNEYALTLLPKAYWRLGEAVGETIAVDEIGDYNGTFVNSPTLETPSLLVGDSDTAISLNGTNQYVSLTADTEDLTAAVSFFCVCNLDSTDTGYGSLIELNGEFGGKRLDIHFGNQQMNVYTAYETDMWVDISFDVKLIIVAIWDLPNQLRSLYINNVLVNSQSCNLTASKYGGFNLGAHVGNSYYPKCVLDESILFDRALTATERTNLYDLALGGSL